MNSLYPARVVVDIKNLIHNGEQIKKQAPGQKWCAVVKGNGYNHGIIEVSLAFIKAGADYLGVAQPFEALKLRKYIGQDLVKVLCWMPNQKQDLKELVDNNIEISLGNSWVMDSMEKYFAKYKTPVKIHIKLDCSFGRDGFRKDEIDLVIPKLKVLKDKGAIEIVGLWNHLPCADEPDHPSNKEIFDYLMDTREKLVNIGLKPELTHLSNSSALTFLPDYKLDMIRSGIFTYGLGSDDFNYRPNDLNQIPALKVEAMLTNIHTVKKGEGVSYSHKYIAKEDTTIGIIPIGYVDGFPRSQNGYNVYCPRTKNFYPVIGTVCMDQFFIKISPLDDLIEGDIIQIFGDEPLINLDLAKACNTAQIDVCMWLGKNIPYFYKNVDLLGDLANLYDIRRI